MEDKIKEIYNINFFLKNKNASIVGYLTKEGESLETLLNKMGYEIKDDIGFDDYIKEMYTFLSNLEKAFRKIIGINNLTIFSQEGRLVLGRIDK